MEPEKSESNCIVSCYNKYTSLKYKVCLIILECLTIVIICASIDYFCVTGYKFPNFETEEHIILPAFSLPYVALFWGVLRIIVHVAVFKKAIKWIWICFIIRLVAAAAYLAFAFYAVFSKSAPVELKYFVLGIGAQYLNYMTFKTYMYYKNSKEVPYQQKV